MNGNLTHAPVLARFGYMVCLSGLIERAASASLIAASPHIERNREWGGSDRKDNSLRGSHATLPFCQVWASGT